MAQTTATITLTTADMADSAFSVSNTSTLTTAGTDTGISETTGLGRKKFATTDNVVLLDGGLTSGIAADVTADKSAKVYIKNHNLRGDGTKFVNILLAAVEIGRLYGGDWMFIPWCAASGKDIEFTASDATETTLEYTCFYE
tara:strand:- start:86 stop:511 length:426 start_codon:yes stop_codon:yes gene_type:complete